VGVRNEFGGCGEPAGIVGFEGALVDVAFSVYFAAFGHDVVYEELFAGADEVVDAVFPDCAAVCLGSC
jgi:hypothetical protein